MVWKSAEKRNAYQRKLRRKKRGLPLDYPIRKIETRNINWNDPEEVKAYNREYYKKRVENDPEFSEKIYKNGRKNHIFRNYNLTQEKEIELLKMQDYRCASCKSELKPKNIHVDHDHTTNIIRGLLCSNCNTGIGLLGDNLSGLNNAVNYLSKFETSFF